MTSAEFWERFGELTPVEILALQLRATESQAVGPADAVGLGTVARNGSSLTPGGSGATDSGEDGAPLP